MSLYAQDHPGTSNNFSGGILSFPCTGRAAAWKLGIPACADREGESSRTPGLRMIPEPVFVVGTHRVTLIFPSLPVNPFLNPILANQMLLPLTDAHQRQQETSNK